MQKISATFVSATPMFLSGADQKKFELRGASFKGVLRFWWRALAYSRLHGNLAQIHKEECRIFGSADSGQGLFKIRMKPVGRETIVDAGQILKHNNAGAGSGILYLGYGVVQAATKKGVHEKGQLIRPCVLAPFRFQIVFLFRDQIDDSVIGALKILGLLGGLGSRSRRGFGSVTLEKIEGDIQWEAPVDVGKYKKDITTILNSPGSVLPAYSAFSADSRITIVNSGADAMSLLENIGVKMQLYRSWLKAEKNFFDDHELAYQVADGDVPKTHPERVVFGLPHNYYLSKIKKNVDVAAAEHNRRASPFMIHIHRFGDSHYAGICTILPSEFLPNSEQIKIKSHKVPQKIDYKILHQFIDGREGPRAAKTGPDYFPIPPRIEIYP